MRTATLILGVAGILIGGAIFLISLLLPQMTRGVSMSEAMVGIVGGLVLLIVAFDIAVAGRNSACDSVFAGYGHRFCDLLGDRHFNNTANLADRHAACSGCFGRFSSFRRQSVPRSDI